MKKRALFKLCCLITLSLNGIIQSFAEYPVEAFKKDLISQPAKIAAPGTYQFIVTLSENGDPFTKDILVMVENYRDDTEERILPLTQFTKVRIPSRAKILDPKFQPLKEIVYIPNHKPVSQPK